MPKAPRWDDQQLAEFRARRAGQLPPKPVPAKPAKRPKYRNARVQVDGVTHDSSKEARRWAVLEQLAAAGAIIELQRQVVFVLAPAVHLAGEKRKKPALRYIADATYRQDGQLVVEDTKSAPTRKTAAYRIKKHLMATVHGIHIKEV